MWRHAANSQQPTANALSSLQRRPCGTGRCYCSVPVTRSCFIASQEAKALCHKKGARKLRYCLILLTCSSLERRPHRRRRPHTVPVHIFKFWLHIPKFKLNYSLPYTTHPCLCLTAPIIHLETLSPVSLSSPTALLTHSLTGRQQCHAQ